MSHDMAALICLGSCLLAAWNLGRLLPWWWDEYVPVDRGLRVMTAVTAIWTVVAIGILIWVVQSA